MDKVIQVEKHKEKSIWENVANNSISNSTKNPPFFSHSSLGSLEATLPREMVSRRKILSRSRDDLNLDSTFIAQEEEEDVWYQKDKLYKVGCVTINGAVTTHFTHLPRCEEIELKSF